MTYNNEISCHIQCLTANHCCLTAFVIFCLLQSFVHFYVTPWARPHTLQDLRFTLCTGPQGKTSGGIHQETNKSVYGWKTYSTYTIQINNDQYSTIVHTIHNDNHGNTSNCHNNASNHNYHSKHHNVLVTDNASGHQDSLFKNVLQALG